MKIKPTLRKDGLYRSTHAIKLHVDIFDIIQGVYYLHEAFGDALPKSRTSAMQLTLKAIEMNGRWFTYEGDVDQEWAKQAVKLFPDLANGADLKQFGV